MKTKHGILNSPIVVILLSLILNANYAKTQTDIPAGNVSGVWLLANSPYNINGEITIPNDSILEIEPSVVVTFTGHYKFNIQGRLLAIGTAGNTITFTAQDTAAGWNGLRFINTPATNDSSKILYCRLQYGLTTAAGDSLGGAILVKGFDRLVISHCLIIHNKTIGDPYTGGAAIAIGSGSPLVENNTICYNNAEGGHGGGIFVFGASNSTIRNNLIYKNQAFGGGAIAYFMATPLLMNNTITENSGTNHGGASCVIACTPKIVNTIIYGNSSPIGEQFHFQSGAQASFYNCNIEGGKSAFAREFTSGGSFSGKYENTIDSDPLFSDTTEDNFHLTDESPCISTGADSVMIGSTWYVAPDSDFDGNFRPNPANTTPDMGALENPTGYYNPPAALNEKAQYDENGVQLFQNYPNPFNSNSTIRFALPVQSDISLKLFNMTGRLVAILANGLAGPGEHTVSLNAKGLAEGTYFYQLSREGYIQTRKCIITR
jgi:parallel beta-helix repeat protein